jgi:uncharacterized protein
MRVVLAGASGLIGPALRESLLSVGHTVTTLVRRAASSGEATWYPDKREIDPSVLVDADAVVCLSGAGVGEHRWTDSYKQAIVSSRVDSVGTLARAVADLGADAPGVFVSASAVGYYGDCGDTEIVESSPSGSTFLAGVCRDWEGASAPAEAAGARVAHLRSGLVLAPSGGLLGRLRPIARAGIAGRLGNGRQFMPWISLADEIAAIRFVLEHDVRGAVNLVGPAPARNAEFMTALGRAVHRPTVLPTPGFALRIALGGIAEEILGGQRAIPAVLTDAGFTFTHPDLDSALEWALAKS